MNQTYYQGIICPRCGSNNVNIQIVNEAKLVNAHHGIIWWIFIGWWWIVIKWLYFTIPALIFKIFGSKRKKIVNVQKKIVVCQHCGNSFEIK